jgi:hypothetical protein
MPYTVEGTNGLIAKDSTDRVLVRWMGQGEWVPLDPDGAPSAYIADGIFLSRAEARMMRGRKGEWDKSGGCYWVWRA